MKYMLLIYTAENAMSETERQCCYEDSAKLAHDLAARGQYIAASPLRPVSTARSLRLREGKRFVTDGPFAETREQLGGFYLVDTGNLDEAIDIASRLPPVTRGTVEIRPVLELPGLPPSR